MSCINNAGIGRIFTGEALELLMFDPHNSFYEEFKSHLKNDEIGEPGAAPGQVFRCALLPAVSAASHPAIIKEPHKRPQMSDKPISRFPVPDLNELPEDIQDRILAVQEKSGFIPNVFLALAHRPDEFRAFFAYHDALMEKEGGLTKGEREMIVVATSGLNQCIYCVAAHGAILRIREKNPLLADQLATNYRKADITPRQEAMLDFAVKVALHAYEINDSDLEKLREHDFSDEDIWDIGAIAAFFALSNRMANLTSMRPNDEFYLLGRNVAEVKNK